MNLDLKTAIDEGEEEKEVVLVVSVVAFADGSNGLVSAGFAGGVDGVRVIE